MSPWLQDHGATLPLVPFSESAYGTTITGEEGPLKRFSTLKRGEDITVRIFLLMSLIEQLKAINRVRIGEENEVTNLIDYLTNTTVRE